MCTDVFGAKWKKFKIAHLPTGDSIGVELFEFANQENAYRMIYMEDPFGNILEIYCHSYELTYVAGSY